MGIFLRAVFICMATASVQARPVSYPGGSTLMVFADNAKNALYYHYSPTSKYSLGIEILEDRYREEDYSYLRFTYLLNRKNTEKSQRNLYFQSGVSTDGLRNHFYGIHGDWETRRWYAGFGAKQIKSQKPSLTDTFFQFGIAPYLGEYGDFHTWLMLKTRKNSLDGEWHSYPVLKVFKGKTLLELGYSKNAYWDVHLMHRF
jgi:hypothetical protein